MPIDRIGPNKYLYLPPSRSPVQQGLEDLGLITWTIIKALAMLIAYLFAWLLVAIGVIGLAIWLN